MADTPRTPTVGAAVFTGATSTLSNPLAPVPANNAISLSGTLSFSKNTARASLAGSVRVGQAGEDYIQAMVTVGTVEETVDIGAIGTIGWCAFRNTDASNFVLLGGTPGVYTLRLDAGTYVGPVQWYAAHIYAKADTAACEVEYLVIER